MKITTHQSSVRMIRPEDPKFRIVDGMVVVPRAGFEIKKECPNTYKEVIEECVRRGWLVPVAHMRDTELFWDAFKE
jgi:hypothetical protein